jgi:hypothetical protein
MDMYTSDEDVDKDGEGEATEMLVEGAVQRGAEHIRTLLEHNLLLQINKQESSSRYNLLHSTDQTTCDEILASVNACFTAGTPSAMEPDSWSSGISTLMSMGLSCKITWRRRTVPTKHPS